MAAHKSPATRTPKDVAREVSVKLGRKVDAKRVRAWVRDNVDAFDDDGYTAHLYSAAQYRTIVDGLVKRGRSARPVAASKGRSGPSKPRAAGAGPLTTASKPPTARKMGSGPVPRTVAAVTAEGQS